MTVFYSLNSLTFKHHERGTPSWLCPRLLKDLEATIMPFTSYLPPKLSGYPHAVFALFQCCIQVAQLSSQKVAKWMNEECIKDGIMFQKMGKTEFSNKKKKRCFPDQPALSRYLNNLSKKGNIEEFWNIVNFAHLLLLREIRIIDSTIILIADYKKETCKKNKNDPYCFGAKEGKTYYKTLTFSVISRDLHQVIANFKIYKRQHKLPLFEKIMNLLLSKGFQVKYVLLDRGFYRKQLLMAFKQWNVTVIMPGRKCALITRKIHAYLTKKGTRYCKGYLKLAYKKGTGYPLLKFDMLLCAKRKYRLDRIKRDFTAKKLTRDEAAKRIFPLLILRGTSGGITALRGNEQYIRALYRRRWLIEIAFREMNKLGFPFRTRNRDVRLGSMGAKSLLYNIWQVQRHLLHEEIHEEDPLTLDEFLGKTRIHRYPQYVSQII